MNYLIIFNRPNFNDNKLIQVILMHTKINYIKLGRLEKIIYYYTI